VLNKLNVIEFEVFHQGDLPGIVAITETWLSDEIENPILPMSERYSIFRHDRKSLGGGVALFVRNDISCHPLSTPCNETFEALFVKLTSKLSTIVVAVCYKPNVADVHLLPEFEKMLRHLDSLKECYIVLGDFNLPDVKWDVPSAPTAHKQEKFMCAFLEHGLSQCVLEPTRGNAVLDLVFESKPSTVMNVVVSNSVGTSDHNTVWFDLNMRPDVIAPSERFAWRKMDHAGIMVALEMTNWSNVFANAGDCDAMWQRFVEYCDTLFTEYVPKVHVNACSVRKTTKMPNSVKNVLAKKKCAYRKLKFAPTEQNKLRYREISKTCSAAVKRHVLISESQVLLNNDLKKFYSYVRRRLNSKPKMPNLVVEGEIFTDDAGKARALNRQFSSVFIDDNTCNTLSFPFGENELCETILADVVITRKMVANALNTFKTDSAMGPDNIPVCFLKTHAEQLANPLQKLFCRTFDEGCLPSMWKTATVAPIYKKKGSCTSPAAYRPVSLTCIVCKVQEKVLKFPLCDHLKRNKIISEHQHGFLSGRSTQTQLLQCLNDWSRAIDNGAFVDVLYIDISKAFDSVSHKLLMEKLRSYGIAGKFLRWIGSFFKRPEPVCKSASNCVGAC
jgi:hypothetical protein